MSYCEAIGVSLTDCQTFHDSSNNLFYLKLTLSQDHLATQLVIVTFWAKNPSTVVTGYSNFRVKTYWKDISGTRPLID